MRIRGSRSGQSLRSFRVGDVQRAVVARIVQIDADRRRRRERTLSVAMRLHLRKCDKTWRSVELSLEAATRKTQSRSSSCCRGPGCSRRPRTCTLAR